MGAELADGADRLGRQSGGDGKKGGKIGVISGHQASLVIAYVALFPQSQ